MDIHTHVLYFTMIYWNEPAVMEFVKREKRFFAYMNYNGETIQTYCSNTGKMQGLLVPGVQCIMSKKLTGIPWLWEAAYIDNTWVGTNTSNSNALAKVACEQLGLTHLKPEQSFGHFRADFASSTHVVEVKHVHLKINNTGYFPDCVSTRATRQINDMIELQSQGLKCIIMYLVKRSDVNEVSAYETADPLYYDAVQRAKKAGIEFVGFNTHIDLTGIRIHEQIAVGG